MTNRIHYCYLLTRALPEGGSMYYVGIRTCPVGKVPETDTKYMGSGRAIRRAVKAHPGAFSKTILDVFDTRAEARAMECALVGLPTADSKWSYNLVTGGEDSGLASVETKARLSAAKLALFEDPSEREKISAGNLRRYEDPARLEAQAERNRELAQDPAWREAHFWNKATPEARANHAAQVGAASQRAWDSYTPEQKATRLAAQQAGIRRAKAERARVQREVALIFLALVNHYHGGEEAA